MTRELRLNYLSFYAIDCTDDCTDLVVAPGHSSNPSFTPRRRRIARPTTMPVTAPAVRAAQLSTSRPRLGIHI